MSTLAEMNQKYRTIERYMCRDCGNKWWFDLPNCWVCTTCKKTVGKSSSEERI